MPDSPTHGGRNTRRWLRIMWLAVLLVCIADAVLVTEKHGPSCVAIVAPLAAFIAGASFAALGQKDQLDG